MKPRINKKKCLGCGECAEYCPRDAIRIDPFNNIAKIIYNRCDSCNICIEHCPINGAIEIYERQITN